MLKFSSKRIWHAGVIEKFILFQSSYFHEERLFKDPIFQFQTLKFKLKHEEALSSYFSIQYLSLWNCETRFNTVYYYIMY